MAVWVKVTATPAVAKWERDEVATQVVALSRFAAAVAFARRLRRRLRGGASDAAYTAPGDR